MPVELHQGRSASNPALPRLVLSSLVLAASLALAGCHAQPRLNIPPNPADLQASETKAPLSGSPEDDAKLMNVAQVAAQSGDFQAATQLYRKIVNDQPRNFDAQLGLADSLVAFGNLKEATTVYQTAMALSPGDARPYIGLCRVALVDHRPADALAQADLALKAGATRPNVYDAKAIALDLLGRHSEAQETYQQGLKLTPDDQDLKNNYALSLAISGNYEQSINILTQLVQQPGSTARNRQNLALALGLEGNVAAAKMMASHDLSPEDVENNLRYYNLVRSASPPSAQ